MTTDHPFDPVVPQEGWHVLHLFYRVEYGQWQLLGPDEQRQAKTNLSLLIQEIRATEATQLLAFSVVTPKADLGFMLLTPDLQTANAFEKRLNLSLGADVLTPVYSYLSMTERSEYTTSEADYVTETLEKEKGLAAGTPEFDAALEDFRSRMDKYGKDRLYPKLGNRPVLCFYSMGKRRAEKQNWFRMSYAGRKELMQGHARIGRQWAGKIRQLITGSTGLDDTEWFVTLFAHDTHDVKGIVYEMRFDPVSAEYGDFGEFLHRITVAAGRVVPAAAALNKTILMGPVPADFDLSDFINRDLNQICIGPFDLQFHFDTGYFVRCEGRVVVEIDRVSTVVFERNEWIDASLLPKLAGRTFMSRRVEGSHEFSITLKGDARLRFQSTDCPLRGIYHSPASSSCLNLFDARQGRYFNKYFANGTRRC